MIAPFVIRILNTAIALVRQVSEELEDTVDDNEGAARVSNLGVARGRIETVVAALEEEAGIPHREPTPNSPPVSAVTEGFKDAVYGPLTVGALRRVIDGLPDDASVFPHWAETPSDDMPSVGIEGFTRRMVFVGQGKPNVPGVAILVSLVPLNSDDEDEDEENEDEENEDEEDEEGHEDDAALDNIDPSTPVL